MHRSRSARSDYSDGDLDGYGEKEQELQKMERQYRNMEKDKKNYQQESQDLIARQKKEMSTLQSEREEVLKELRLIESASNQNKDERFVEGLGELGRQKTTTEEQIEEESNRHKELDAEIRQWEKKIREQGKNMGGVHMSSQHTLKTRKQASKIENQLQLANNTFCKALEKNRDLREQIDSLRVERNRFENLYKKLEKELRQLKQDIGETIDQSKSAYESREEAQARMILLKEKSDKDIQQHNAEMKELLRIIDHDRKLRDFMNMKGRDRPEDAQLVAWRQRKEAMEAEKKRANQTDSVESYEAAFQRIKEITGEEDIDALVRHFIEVEDKNFALFNYVNEQNNTIVQLSEDIDQIQEDMKTFSEQGIEMEEQRKTILKELEEQQTTAVKEKGEFSEKQAGVMKIIDQLKAGIDSLFNKINCDRAAIDDMLGAQTGVLDQNMLQYLGIVEERTNQLLLIQAYTTQQNSVAETNEEEEIVEKPAKDYEEYVHRQVTLLGEGPSAQAQPPSIAPPAVGSENSGDEYESDGSQSDEDPGPMTREDLINRAMKSVKKREVAMKKRGFDYDMPESRERSKKKDKKSAKH